MTHRITYLLDLFNKRVFHFQKIVESEPKYIETNVTDDTMNEIRILRDNLKDEYRNEQAKERIS